MTSDQRRSPDSLLEGFFSVDVTVPGARASQPSKIISAPNAIIADKYLFTVD